MLVKRVDFVRVQNTCHVQLLLFVHTHGYGFGSLSTGIPFGLVFGCSFTLKKYSHCIQKETDPCSQMAMVPILGQDPVPGQGSESVSMCVNAPSRSFLLKAEVHSYKWQIYVCFNTVSTRTCQSSEFDIYIQFTKITLGLPNQGVIQFQNTVVTSGIRYSLISLVAPPQ